MAAGKKHHELYQELGSIVGAEYVSDDRAVLLSYTRDMSPFPPGKPQGAVVRPGSVEEVVEIVRLANQTRIPIVIIGGGKASLSGTPPGQPGRGILLDTRRMDKILKIDEENMTVTAQCGIVEGELMDKIKQRGFETLTSSTPLYVNTLGGHMSGYSGGGFSKYGFSTGPNAHFILGVKVVLPDGTIVDTGTGEGGVSAYHGHTWGRSVHGPDITGMFIADGGIFGVKVEATFKMFRLPAFQKKGSRCWNNLEDAYHVMRELWEIDPYIYMQPYSWAMIIGPEFAQLVNPDAERTWVIPWLVLANTEEEAELKNKTIETVCDKYGGKIPDAGVNMTIDKFLAEQAEMGKISTMGQMPFLEVLVSARDALEAHKWSCEWFYSALAERGIDKDNMVIMPLLFPFGSSCWDTCMVPFFDQRDKEMHGIMHELMVEYLELSRRRGYIIEASQGHESRLRAQSWTPEYYQYIRNLKKMLDPNNIMNPGIYFP